MRSGLGAPRPSRAAVPGGAGAVRSVRPTLRSSELAELTASGKTFATCCASRTEAQGPQSKARGSGDMQQSHRTMGTGKAPAKRRAQRHGLKSTHPPTLSNSVDPQLQGHRRSL